MNRTQTNGEYMKMIAVGVVALTLAAGAAKADTLLDGTFNGSFNCAKYQGVTNATATFILTGTRVRTLLTIYHSQSSRYCFATSVLDYTGYYNAAKRTFLLTGFKTVGLEPRGWSYDNKIQGTVAADGSSIAMDGNFACTGLQAKRVTTTSTLAK